MAKTKRKRKEIKRRKEVILDEKYAWKRKLSVRKLQKTSEEYENII